MSAGIVSAGAALVVGATCALISYRALLSVRALAPAVAEVLIARARDELAEGASPHDPEAIAAELELERRSALENMKLLLLRPRAAARIALAAGTGCSVVALAAGLAGELARALTAALVCFMTGAVASFAAAHLGRSASSERERIRDEWNRRCGEAAQMLQIATLSATAKSPDL